MVIFDRVIITDFNYFLQDSLKKNKIFGYLLDILFPIIIIFRFCPHICNSYIFIYFGSASNGVGLVPTKYNKTKTIKSNNTFFKPQKKLKYERQTFFIEQFYIVNFVVHLIRMFIKYLYFSKFNFNENLMPLSADSFTSVYDNALNIRMVGCHQKNVLHLLLRLNM